MTPGRMLDLARNIERHVARDDVDAVVVTHGTDTVEETALMVDLLVATPKPVVFTAAMRNLSETGADGPRNLADAVRVAIHPESRDRGAMLVVNERIHAARYVTKTNTVNPETFASPEYGPLGQVTGKGVRYLHEAPARRHMRASSIESNIPVVSGVAGSDSTLLDWHIGRGVAGIILEGSGSGNVPAEMADGLSRAIAAGIPVVLTTRVASGFLAPTYGTGAASGGGFDLARLGVIPSLYWRAPKARIALMVALGAGMPHSELAEFFATP
jgi:L-asparaginase